MSIDDDPPTVKEFMDAMKDATTSNQRAMMPGFAREVVRLQGVIRKALEEFDLIAGRYAERDQNLGVDQLNKIWNDLGNEVDSWGGKP